ncbi:hypothetical protein [Taibaiella helva]|uniref:hypothetical protein n=1 Tax=Taibaiella helva TaxID=2301235 RepID=UPI000E5853FB|nr:hypothetical protein [Taibaiella helva]
MKKVTILFAALVIVYAVGCHKNEQISKTQQSAIDYGKKTMTATSSGSDEMPTDGPYKDWIANAVKTTNPARLVAFQQVFNPTEPLAPYLKMTMVNATFPGIGMESIGVILEPDHSNDSKVQDWGIYTDPTTGDLFYYGYALGWDGLWYPGKFWLIDGKWEFFRFQRFEQEGNDKWPIESGIDMDNLAYTPLIRILLKYIA